MRIIDGEQYYSIREVADMLDRQPQTIKNWYKWEQAAGLERRLPEYRRDMDGKLTHYFSVDAVEQLRWFAGQIHYGMMADYNRSKWGTRGKREMQ